MKDNSACDNCGQSARPTGRTCERCESDIGFPNVRSAAKTVERRALYQRVISARERVSQAARGPELIKLTSMAHKSRTVLNRHLGTLFTWLVGDNPLFPPFHHQIEQGRVPKDDVWNRQRASAENTINPNYFRDLNFAALSPDGRGMDYYGPYTILLHDKFIHKRSSLFEKNPFYFCEEHAVISGKDPPIGYRGEWKHKRAVAAAKLGPKLPSDQHNSLEALLMGQSGNSPDCDFIEVHIFGPLHREIISHVRGPKPTNEPDAVLWDQVKLALQHQGSTFEETV